jgi:hypothetical protein
MLRITPDSRLERGVAAMREAPGTSRKERAAMRRSDRTAAEARWQSWHLTRRGGKKRRQPINRNAGSVVPNEARAWMPADERLGPLVSGKITYY